MIVKLFMLSLYRHNNSKKTPFYRSFKVLRPIWKQDIFAFIKYDRMESFEIILIIIHFLFLLHIKIDNPAFFVVV